ncbi:protein kintoun isoform X2 [Solea solea]|uniref:protein kintoun isoform X2 n=1 Tax=Solea solea TaxID=90069 RepID=UPI0027298DFA|nr:protein kintoun isoform X2 [Solea solea]
MENPEKLSLTSEEVDRLGKALKDERFRDMLHEYVQEISDPETRRQYEEEMTLLEQQRGNNIEFIHPTPFKALKTSVDAKHKCFINICASDKVGKPECKSGVSEDGRRGQHWTLPHSLLPGREDSDPKGNKVIIYDVVFHPDTLHIASKDKRFMDLVVSTAVNGIQDTLKVTLDKKNVRQLNAKYKGTPQPCVIRKPISGYKAKEASENPDPLAFPIQDEIRPNATHNCDSKADESVQIQPQEASAPTKPRFTVKYRSFIDLQDYRCSRDSATSPRPKEIVVTVDLPLLKSVRDANLEVKERRLLLDSKKPAYRLELPLAYPVDEDKGQAKFNKQRGQLTVTLPVLPSTEAWDSALFGSRGAQGSAGGDDDHDKENETGGTTGVEQPSGVEEERIQEELKQQMKLAEDPAEDREEVLEGEEQNVEGEEEREEQVTKVLEGEAQNVEREEREEQVTKVLEGEAQNVEREEREEQMTKVLEGEEQHVEPKETEEQMTKVLEGEEQNVECEEEREEQMTKVLEGEEQNVEGKEEREEQMTKVLEGEEQNVEGEEEREEQMTKVLEGEEQNVEGEEEREEQMTKVLEGEEQNVEGEEEREEQMTKVLEGEEQNVEGEEEREEQMTKVLEGEAQNVECEEREEQMTKVLEGEEQNVDGEEEREEQMTKVLEGEEQNVEGEEEREEQMTKVLEGEEQNVEGEEREEQMTKVLEGEAQNVKREEREEQMTKVLEGEEQNVEGEEEREEQMTKVLEGEVQNVEREEREEQMSKVLEDEEQHVEPKETEEQMTKVLEGKDLGEGVKGQEEKCRKQRREGEESEVVIHVEEATWKEQNREGEVAAVNLNATEMKTPHVTRETENTKENVQVKADESHTATMTASLHDTAEAGSASLSGPGKRDESEEIDEDDLQTEQVFETKGPEAALLREKDADGNEKVISDHSTSAGFVFRNTLIYTLD